MKEVLNQLERNAGQHNNDSPPANPVNGQMHDKNRSGRSSNDPIPASVDQKDDGTTGLLEGDQLRQSPFFTEKAFLDMSLGRIPDFEPIYRLLSAIRIHKGAPVSAIQFLPALRAFSLTHKEEIINFLNNPETNHVLVQNDLIKIVLIRWEPGDECNIHGHAERGCVFKVLQGKIVEKRFSTKDASQQLAEGIYEKDNIAYIDDIMGLHKVCNPFDSPAITLHMYTPGNYKPVKKK